MSSYAVVSDIDQTCTIQMACFKDAILIHLNNTGMAFEWGVHFWTDGCARNFKNRYAMVYLSRFVYLYGAAIATWHFNESYHGKGPMDGIGAVLKHNIYLAELRGEVTVNNVNDFFDAAKNIIRNVTVLFRPKKEVEEWGPEFSRLWQNAGAYNGITRARCLKQSVTNP